MASSFTLDPTFTILGIGAIGIVIFFLYMKYRPIQGIKIVDIPAKLNKRLGEQAMVNRTKQRYLRDPDFIFGKIISNIPDIKNLPTSVSNPDGEFSDFKDIKIHIISIFKKNIFKLIWWHKLHYVIPENMIIEEGQDVLISSKAKFIPDHGVWREETLYPVATSKYVSGLYHEILHEISTNQNATMMENLQAYIPHHGHDAAMLKKETDSHLEKMEAKRADVS